jgi:hypothetical protein
VIPRHSYDPNYLPVPDAPEASMLDVSDLPADVQWALKKARDHELNGAAWPTLLDQGVRAWFRYQERSGASRETDAPRET